MYSYIKHKTIKLVISLMFVLFLVFPKQAFSIIEIKLHESTEIIELIGRNNDQVICEIKNDTAVIQPVSKTYLKSVFHVPLNIASNPRYIIVPTEKRVSIIPEDHIISEFTYNGFLEQNATSFWFHDMILGGLLLLFLFTLILNYFLDNRWLSGFLSLTALQLFLFCIDNTNLGGYLLFDSIISWSLISVFIARILFGWYTDFYFVKHEFETKEAFSWFTSILIILLSAISITVNDSIFNLWVIFINILYLGWFAYQLLSVIWGFKLRTKIATIFIVTGFFASWVFHVFSWYQFIPLLHELMFICLIIASILILMRLSNELNSTIKLYANNAAILRNIGWMQVENTEDERSEIVGYLQRDTLNRLSMLGQKFSLKNTQSLELSSNIKDTLDSLKDYVYDLYPPHLEFLEFEQIIDRQAIKLKKSEKQITLNYQIEGIEQVTITQKIKLGVFRIIQEYIKFFDTDLRNNTLNADFIVSDNKGSSELKIELYHLKGDKDEIERNSYSETQILTLKKVYQLQLIMIVDLNTIGWGITLPLNGEINDDTQ